MSCVILFYGVVFMNFPSIVIYSCEKLDTSQEEMAHIFGVDR